MTYIAISMGVGGIAIPIACYGAGLVLDKHQYDNKISALTKAYESKTVTKDVEDFLKKIEIQKTLDIQCQITPGALSNTAAAVSGIIALVTGTSFVPGAGLGFSIGTGIASKLNIDYVKIAEAKAMGYINANSFSSTTGAATRRTGNEYSNGGAHVM